jgi:hypothetical protein
MGIGEGCGEPFCDYCLRSLEEGGGCPQQAIPFIADGGLDWRERIRYRSPRRSSTRPPRWSDP